MEIFDNKIISLKEAGKDENWLHQWIIEKPERLGIGNIDIVEHELIQYKNKGGILDLLAFNKNSNTYYEIEVMLGECDSDHGFRTLDYWARERISKPNSLHYAVLIAENLQGRYKTIIETLPQFLPFIGIEIRTLQINDTTATTYAEIIAQPDDLIEEMERETLSGSKGLNPRDEDWWRENRGNEFVDTVKEMFEYCNLNLGKSQINYTASSYISLKKGWRVWLPMWPRTNGFYVYLPDDNTGTNDTPSKRYDNLKEKLKPLGLEPSWAPKYNNLANPIGLMIPKELMKNDILLDILKESYELA